MHNINDFCQIRQCVFHNSKIPYFQQLMYFPTVFPKLYTILSHISCVYCDCLSCLKFQSFIICVKYKFSTDFHKIILFIKNIHSFNKSINCKLFRHILQFNMYNYSRTVLRLPSSSRSFLFISIPSPYPPIDPSAAITL